MRNLIIGAARSGIASAKYLLEQGQEVILSDISDQKKEEISSLFRDKKPEFLWGVQPDVEKLNADRLILSPGVPLTIPPIQRAKLLGIPIIGEVELAYQAAKCNFVGITGTNGKTTTTSWVAHALQSLPRKVLVGGNIGTPLISQVAEMRSEDIIVAEMSSFQLESIDRFQPHIATILNLTPDHVDWHGSLESYYHAKMNIFKNQGQEDFLIINAEDSLLVEMAREAKSTLVSFSKQQLKGYGIGVEDGKLVYLMPGMENYEVLIRADEISLKGQHNLENAMAVACNALLCGVSKENLIQSLRTFSGVDHRMEKVDVVEDVKYINDSKGTNPEATMRALGSYDQGIVIILGGHNKGVDLEPLCEMVKEKCKQAILLGEASEEFKTIFEKITYTYYTEVENMAQAVQKASEKAQRGDVVLLSPACTSWDQYNSYEERGEDFKRQVRRLGNKR